MKITAYLLLFILINITVTRGQDVPIPPEPVTGFSSDLFKYMKLSEEEEKEYLKNIKAELKENLKEIKETNESRYYELLREYYFRNMRFPMMRKIEKDMVNTQQEVLEYEIVVEALASKYKKASGGDRNKIKQDLENKITALFDLKEKNREFEVRELETRLEELKNKMKLRQNNKSTIIKRRMEELLGEDRYLEWE